MTFERTSIETSSDAREAAAKNFKFTEQEASVERQGISGSMDAKAQKDLETIAKGKERYSDNEFMKELGKDTGPEAQAVFNILMTFDSRRLNLLEAFLNRKNSDVNQLKHVEDQDLLLELLKRYGGAPDDGNLKAIESEIAQIPDLA